MLRYILCMAITDVLYDLTSGTAGAVMGALVMSFFNSRKNKRLNAEIGLHKKDIEALRLENNRLLEVIKDKENQILVTQKKILKKKTGK